ncbi:MAG TPA: polysaccharide biosynthesis tyrosine autokinase, partial [Candidatus Solibacter sp.]|nr:polysaccharide biosynthesis tyrosine autokinase [Candidatus Solibacter sp.]
QRTSQWMESQLEESKFRLQQAGEKLRQFVANSGTDFFLDQTTLADSKLRQLQSNVAAIQADRIGKQSRWELVKNSPVENIGDVIADGNLESMKARVADLKRERAQLTTTLTDENPKVTKVQAQINEIEGTLQKEKVSLKKRIQAEYEEAQKREKLLLEAYNRQTHTVSGQADKAAQYSMLKRDVEMEQQLYNMLLQQSSQAALIALAPSSSIRVVDPALPSSFPSSPAPTRDIPTGVMLGGGVGFGLLVLLDITKKKKLAALFNTPGHTQTLLGVPELGVIPSAELDRPRKRLPAWPGRVIDTGENGDSEPELVRWQSNKASLLAESFRQTLVSILGTRPKDHNPIYVIASAGPSEGKTTLCANLAAAMADIGHRVLVIDADLRRSHLHSLFGVNGGRGLGDILVGSEPVAKLDLSEYTHPSPTANLSVMPHGRAEFDTPALLFFSERTQQLISLLQSRYDCIFFDTPPSLAFPDARLLGKHSDGVVLVVRAGITSRETAAAACQRFLSDGIPVLGTILNDWKPTDNRQYGAYYYGNGAYNKK